MTVRRYRLAADLHGENTGAELDELLDVIRRYEYAKQLGYDPSSQTVIPLSADELQQLSRKATIAEYRLSNGYVSLSEEDATCSALADLMHNITRYFILVIMVYLGARWIAGAWRAARLSFSLTMPQRRSCRFCTNIDNDAIGCFDCTSHLRMGNSLSFLFTEKVDKMLSSA